MTVAQQDMAFVANAPPVVRLAWNGGGGKGRVLPTLDPPPALLVSFVYLRPFDRMRPEVCFRDWAMDSGAFSAKQLGITIDLKQYIETCQERMASDSDLTEIFALDVIGDWKTGLKNTEAMWAEGIPAIPAFHMGEPEDVLLGLARDYPKIALGGCARVHMKAKLEFAKQCFARVWPKKIHGFGFGSRTAMMLLPFHSTDCTSWLTGPAQWAEWITFASGKMGKLSVRGEAAHSYRCEIEHYMQTERDVRRRWAKEMARLEGAQA